MSDVEGPGSTVHVAAGSYTSLQTLDYDKAVTLKGAQAGVDARTGRPDAGNESVARLDVTAGDLTIDGFALDAGGQQFAIRANYPSAGTNNGLVIENSVIENGAIYGFESSTARSSRP